MKLRNKKTGEIRELGEDSDYIYLMHFCSVKREQLIDGDWELYLGHGKTTMKKDDKEPLIKDEKIRKAVRAWAEANKFSSKMFFTYYANLYQLSCWQASIEFNKHIEGLEDGKEYYFTELCGEDGE